ncbi:alpha/beta fold hydrolase [Verticiella sediminum]|uniref:Alpha/beta fold hydrolase n=1 Tax=Verticiella sediminum TaxID=1247510 RepID=A0A556AIT0_9BURK|nr:alpha/beta fold hydrolase [Verticiella sediminum]TSH92808.1 alpha/beta fold hydrolase [Verticiella sediminum]
MNGSQDEGSAALDTRVHAILARAWASLSPQSAMLAWLDWASHMAVSPGRQADLAGLALSQAAQLAGYLRECLMAGPGAARACVEPPAQDRRFDAPEWRGWPYNLWHQSFLMAQQWWAEATRGVRGVERHHEKLAAFWARQWLDMLSPGNHLLTNPVALRRTAEEGGANLARGMLYLLDNQRRRLTGLPPEGAEAFEVGRDLAVTPGKVVLRNRLIELIQYAPATGQVRPEPILIVPAWIMKYYILDLSPHNSLIRYLVAQGHTVFCISWKNPGAAESDLGMEDYLDLGFRTALAAVEAIVPGSRVHATGYCLGGTLLAMAAAAMARDGELDRLASLSLFAAQTDFSEPGELALFIDESQLALLEAQMQDKGYLRADQMAGAFQMLRSYDLLWSRVVNEYLLGERRPINDLMAWNADATRLPARMHAQYLRRLFLDDDLSEGRYPVDGRPVSLGGLTLDTFCVGTVTDHVAPWRSVYKLHYLCPAQLTFVLTSGGHNAGIVSEPGRPHRRYQVLARPAGGHYIAPQEWERTAPAHEGSWWPQWQAWLAARSGPAQPPPGMGAPARGYAALCDAPGTYVKEK